MLVSLTPFFLYLRRAAAFAYVMLFRARYLLTVGLSSALLLPSRAQTVPLTSRPLPAAPVAATTLTPQQIDHVTALGQVWGLLKYFHPAVAAGQRDWDAEFLRQLPAVLACRSVAERSRLLTAWVTSFGPVAPCPSCALPPTQPIRLAPDLRWTQQPQRFSGPLRQQLAAIEANRYQGVPYYVTLAKAGNPTFPHEEAYADQACPAQGLRLLAACRYWNMIQYFYPYRYAIGTDWAKVLPQVLPRFAEAATPLSYRHAALALLSQVHDGHARFYPPDPLLEAERGAYRVEATLQFLDDRAVVVQVRRDSLVPAPVLAPGDVLTHVAGTPVRELVRQRLPETPGSNRAAQLNTIAGNLLYSSAPHLALRVERAGQPLALVAPGVPIGTVPAAQPAAADSMYRFLTPDIGYLDLARIKWEKMAGIFKAFAHTRGIIIDQRNYPGEFVARGLPYFLLPRKAVFATYTQADLSYPGRFLWQPADTLQYASGQAAYAGQLVVLVNEVSRSQAEYTAMALQATPHCTLLGSQTAGADGNVVDITLPGGLRVMMSGLGIYYPDKRETQRIGLVPDVHVRPTLAGVRAERDELRDRAVELIRQAPAPSN